MYTKIYLVPSFDAKLSNELPERWQGENHKYYDFVLTKIKSGGGEDFLIPYYQNGELPILEDGQDLRGFDINGLTIKFPSRDNFENIDFSYSTWYHSSFINGCFYCTFNFSRIFHCTFSSSYFYFNSFFGTQFENVKFINCDFIESCSFSNCSFKNCEFFNCHFSKRHFFDCKFDTRTKFSKISFKPVNCEIEQGLSNKEKANFYNGIAEGYLAGNIQHLYNHYQYLKNKNFTYYNSVNAFEKTAGLISQFLIGYGLKPMRPILWVLFLFLIACTWFSTVLDTTDAIFLTCGSILTFGAKVHLLEDLPFMFHLLYIITAFCGISGIALFITVLSNVLRRHD